MVPDQSSRPSGVANGAESTGNATGFCRRYWFTIVLLTITLVGAAMRMVHLDSTIGVDEANEMRIVMGGGFRRVFHPLSEEEAVARRVSRHDRVVAVQYHRLNAILAILSAKVFGSSIWAWRLPSYLFGVGLIPLIALFVKHAFHNQRMALLAAGLVTFSYPLFSYSSANRGNAALAFFAVAACFSLHRTLGSPTILNLVLLAFTAFCLGISHMFALILLGALGCYLALHIVISLRSKTLKAHGAILALAALLVGVLLTVWLYSRNTDLVPAVVERITTGSFPEGSNWPTNSRSHSAPIAEWLVHLQRWHFRCQARLVPIYWFLIIAGAPAVLRRSRRAGWLIICGVFLSLAVCCALHVTPSKYRVRYVLFMLPLMLVLIASSIDFIAEALGSAMAKIAGKKLVWCSAAVSVMLLAATSGPGAQAVFRELRRPGLTQLAVYWDCKGAADYVGNHIRNGDVVLAFPLDSKKRQTTFSSRFFRDSIKPHLFWAVYPRLTEMPKPVTTSSVWYVTPHRDDFEQDFLPVGSPLELAAEFDKCFVYRYLVETRNMRQIPLPPFDFGKRRPAEWQLSYLNRRAANVTVHAAQESPLNTRSVSIQMKDGGFYGRAQNSHLLAVMPGGVVHLGTDVAVDQRQEARPHFVLSLAFFDETGKPIAGSHATGPRPGYCDLNLAPSKEWYPCRVSTFVPRGAHYMKVRMGLGSVFSSSAGDVIRIREPALLADWSESEVLARVFSELDGKPLPDDMSDFQPLTIENGDFQTEDGKVSSWSSQRYSGKFKYAADEVGGLKHSRFVRVIVQEDKTNWALYSEPVTVVPGSTLRLMADVTNVSSTTAVVIRFLDAEGKRIRDVYSFASQRGVPLITGSRWSRIRIDRDVPDKAVQMSIGLRITEASCAGDEFMFRPVSLWVKDAE